MASSLSHYYSNESLEPSPSIFEPAQAAFDQALETLKQRSTKQFKKRQHIFEATSLRDVLDAVATAQNRYEKEHTKSKARTCITELSKRICYYGKVMDVLVQHHPEYVSLAWGTMKLVFGAIVEHEKLGRTIITGLCDVADSLPRIEVAAYLYPTNAIKQAVSVLYAHIIKFLLRALEWYEEGKIAHAIHSVTKPAALRYDDLLEDIGRATRRISELASMSSQAEQRDMHNEHRDLTLTVKQLKEDIQSIKTSALLECRHALSDFQLTQMHNELRALALAFKQLKDNISLDQSIKTNALLEYRHALSDFQSTQALAYVSSACSVDHKSTLQESLLIRDKHRFVSYRRKCPPFWMSSEIYAWNANQHSSLITLQAPFRNRFYIRDFCTNVIEQLRNAGIAVLWVLKPREQTFLSAIKVLESLFHQALTLDYSSHTDSILTFRLRRFLDAHSTSDYINLLGNCLEHFKLVYIMVDAGAMNPVDASQCKQHLQELSQRLSERDASTILKVMTLSYGPYSQSLQEKDSILLKVGNMSRRKGKNLPSEPLQSVLGGGRQHVGRGRLSSFVPLRARGRAVRAAAD